MFEDTPEFVARYIVREARAYLDSLAPPFFRALTHYAQDGSYSWHCPGHSGGVAFLKSPVGQMFHQFFGENLLRADVCNAVDELGQLLDHSGPVAAPSATPRASSTATTCSSSPTARRPRTRWSGTRRWRRATWWWSTATATSRSCTRSHDRRGAGVPDADAQPLRHHRADPARGVPLGEHREEDPRQPVREGREGQAARADDHAEHLRRHLYNVDTIKEMLDGGSTRCTSTRRGCRTRRSTSSTAACTPSAATGRAARSRWCSRRSRRTSCWRGCRRPRRSWCRRASAQARRHRSTKRT
jgi:arginine decarboxylase